MTIAAHQRNLTVMIVDDSEVARALLRDILEECGYRVLVVDLDPQANASEYLLSRKPSELNPTIEHFFDAVSCELWIRARPNWLSPVVWRNPL